MHKRRYEFLIMHRSIFHHGLLARELGLVGGESLCNTLVLRKSSKYDNVHIQDYQTVPFSDYASVGARDGGAKVCRSTCLQPKQNRLQGPSFSRTRAELLPLFHSKPRSKQFTLDQTNYLYLPEDDDIALTATAV